MKTDEFAFFNQQLAAMLENGLPLEGALKELCANMQRGALRAEIEALAGELEKGVPLQTALKSKNLPDFYRQMILIGVKANNLPSMLLMLADYYQRANSIWTRLKGLMLYPMIVLVCAFTLSCFLTFLLESILDSGLFTLYGASATPPGLVVQLLVPPILIGLMIVLTLVIALAAPLRRRMRWRLPAFKEAKLSQLAAAMELLLKNGGTLPDSLALIQQMERGTAAEFELAVWQSRLSSGVGNFAAISRAGTAFPPLFVWLVASAGEDLAAGFKRAADMYRDRAIYRTEMFLYAALPFAVLILGGMIVTQVTPVVASLVRLMNMISQP